MVFTTLTPLQLGNAPAVRSERESFFTLAARSNPSLLAGFLGAVAVQLALLYLPGLQRLFATQALSPFQLAFLLVASTAAFGALELEQWILRRQSRRSRQVPALWPSQHRLRFEQAGFWTEQIRHREVMIVTATLEEPTSLLPLPAPPYGPPTRSLQ